MATDEVKKAEVVMDCKKCRLHPLLEQRLQAHERGEEAIENVHSDLYTKYNAVERGKADKMLVYALVGLVGALLIFAVGISVNSSTNVYDKITTMNTTMVKQFADLKTVVMVNQNSMIYINEKIEATKETVDEHIAKHPMNTRRDDDGGDGDG